MTRILLVIAAAFFAGCATLPPVTVPQAAGKVTTFTASASVSVNGKGGGSVRGFLVYRRPDQFRMTVVTPFGLPALDAFLAGEEVTVVVPGDQTAYVGTMADLPATGPLSALSEVSAAADIDWRPEAAGREFRVTGGELRRYDAAGLLVRKELPGGEEIRYGGYADAGGLPFPRSVTVSRTDGMKIVIGLDEPQVNGPLEEDAFTPNLQGARILPLSFLSPKEPNGP